MHKFNRIYYAVLILTVIFFITVSKQIGAINYNQKNSPEYLAVNNSAQENIGGNKNDTIPEKSIRTIKRNVLAKDTVPIKKDTLSAENPIQSKKNVLAKDSTSAVKDSIGLPRSNSIDTSKPPVLDTFKIKYSKDTLSAPVKYSAKDSVIGMVDSKTIELYGSAKTEYQSSSLAAPYLKLDQATGIVTASAAKDSFGSTTTYIEMKDGESEYKSSDTLNYNFKNQRGLIRGTISQQGEMFVHSLLAKKVSENTVYAEGNFFTTCNLDHPHFGFRAKKAKIINKKLAVTGAVRPEFDGVPVPIYLPFGFYPLYQGRHSGFMAPSFETNDQEGVGLSGLGYYLGVSDYWDVQFYGDIYSYGTWRVSANPTYIKNYKYRGNLNFTIQSTKRNTKGDPDYYKSNTYSLVWSHSSDTRSRPGVSFGANVNFSSTNYSRNLSNSPIAVYNNVMGSSITYSKQWIDKPFNLSLSMNHSQNNSSRLMTINFPTANFSMTTIYPFQKKESVGKKKWYEQLGIGYNGSFRNDFNFYDSVSYSRSNQLYGGRRIYEFLLDTARWSANHSIPISLSLPPILGGAVVVSPSVSYSQQWVDGITTMDWGPKTFWYGDSSYVKDTIVSSLERAFKIKQQASFGISFNTALYGMYEFKSKRILALRHVARPTFGLSYTPDLTKNFWKKVKIDSIGTTAIYNQLSGLYSAPVNQFTSTRTGGINFGLDNSLEMKVKAKPKKKTKNKSDESEDTEGTGKELNTYANTSKEDAESGIKKIKLVDGFGFNGSYNFLADSMRLSPIALYFRTNLFEKISLNGSATLVPYKLNDYGYATSTYAWAGGGTKVGTITNASISMSTSFQSKPKDPEKAKAREKAINDNLNDPMLQADQQRLLEYMRQNPAEFVDFNTDWSVSLSFSLNYSRLGRNLNTLQSSISPITSSLNFNGSFSLTPKWNFSVNGYYDFTTAKMQTFSMAISRDLHCWQMAINVTPIGLYRFFNFTISPKSGLLQDLKINRTRSFYSSNR